MGYKLVQYTAEWQTAVARSNQRLRDSGHAPFLLPNTPPLSSYANAAVSREHQLVVDDAEEVRGGCLLQHHAGWVDGVATAVTNLQSPLSEGLFDTKFSGVGPWMMRAVLRRNPLVYCVGMGSDQLPFPRLLRALLWRLEPVPFYFRVLRGSEFLKNMQTLRRHPKLGVLARMGAGTPLLPNWACALAHRIRMAAREPELTAPIGADWDSVREKYAFGADRGEDTLDALYPSTDSSLRRIRVAEGLGVLRVHRFAGHSYFGDLTVATLVEAIAQPGAIRSLLRAARKEALAEQAGLLVTNQSAADVQAGLREEGWFSFPSNYLVGFSPKLAASIGARPFYVTRGDGDGLLNL